MSDISFHFSPLDLIIGSPIFGWPGLIGGAVLGAWLWRRQRILGGVLGAIVGNFAVAFARLVLL